jgi:hypothetical protein
MILFPFFLMKWTTNSFIPKQNPTIAMFIPLSNLCNTYTFSHQDMTFLLFLSSGSPSACTSAFPEIIEHESNNCF